MAEQYVRINGKIFLYKQKAPFVASGMSVFAAIEYDLEEDKLRCHECGEWFEHLGSHVWQTHGSLSRDYKIKHGLKGSSALVNEESRIGQSRRIRAWMLANPEAHQKNLLKAQAAENVNAGGVHRPHGENRNERGHCPAQLLEDIKQLSGKLGHTPSRGEMSNAGISPGSAMKAFNVGTISAVVSLAGLLPNKPFGRRRYSDQVLIEMVRDFYVFHGRLPRMRTDCNRGLLPSRATFRYRLGSLNEIYRAAGLGLVAAAGGK